MKRGTIVWVLSVFVLTGCVTTAGDDNIVEPDQAEAARINRDLAINYMQQGKYDQALRKLQRSLDDVPESSETYRVMGYVYERLADQRRAEEAYRNAVKFGPKDQAALNQLAVYLCLNGKDKNSALDYFDRALDVPNYQDRYAIFTNAGTCAKDVDLVRAEEYLRQGLSLNPNFPEALYQMSTVAYAQENYLQARAFLERCLAVTEPLPEMLLLGHRIESALGDAVAAQRFDDELQQAFPESAQARQLRDQKRDAG